MNNLVRCFGVRLELKPIDFSKCLPKFTLVAEPRVRTQQQTDERSGKTDGKPVESLYWSAFREFWNKNGCQFVPYERNSPNYFGFYIGNLKDFWFAAWRNNIETEIAAKLFMHSADNFDALKAQQRAIASEIQLDEPLEWDKSPRYSPLIPQVGFYKRGLPRGDRSDYHSQFEWLLAAFENLDRVFSTRIENIVSSVGNSSEDDIPF